MFVVIALLTLGGEVIHEFAIALLVGVLVGTYSSSFIATPVVYEWLGSSDKSKEKLSSASSTEAA
jgi:preprotein translocase subunit SecF